MLTPIFDLCHHVVNELRTNGDTWELSLFGSMAALAVSLIFLVIFPETSVLNKVVDNTALLFTATMLTSVVALIRSFKDKHAIFEIETITVGLLVFLWCISILFALASLV